MSGEDLVLACVPFIYIQAPGGARGDPLEMNVVPQKQNPCLYPDDDFFRNDWGDAVCCHGTGGSRVCHALCVGLGKSWYCPVVRGGGSCPAGTEVAGKCVASGSSGKDQNLLQYDSDSTKGDVYV